MSAFVPLPNTAIYCTSKHAASGYSESLCIELEAVKRNEFWTLPYPELIPTLERYNEQMIAALRRYEGDPDYLRRKQLGRGMPEVSAGSGGHSTG